MFVIIAGNGPLTWISLGLSIMFLILPGKEALVLKCLGVFCVLSYLAYKHIPQVRENELVQRVVNYLSRLLLERQVPAGGGGNNRNRTRPYNERFNAAVSSIKKLPIEEYTGPEDLPKEDVKTLRAKLRRRGIDMQGCVEKKDLVAKFLESGTSGESCAICVDDYKTGDLLRVMPKCGHLFHITCIDKWLMESADYSRPVSCPMCKTPV
ncbi:hypothetical protein AAMO2058_000516000 [Amorphochlora amoebiformis]